MKRPKTAAKENVGDVLMTTTVSERKKPDEVRQAGRQESDAPELLVGYLEKIGRDRLLTSREEISLSRRARARDRRACKKLVERKGSLSSRWYQSGIK